jgi:hypothetical protein
VKCADGGHPRFQRARSPSSREAPAAIGAATAARLRAAGAEVAVFDRETVEGYVSLTGDISSSAT